MKTFIIRFSISAAIERYLLVLVTADKGLCGAFNTNLTKAAQSFMRDNADKTIELLANRSQRT